MLNLNFILNLFLNPKRELNYDREGVRLRVSGSRSASALEGAFCGWRSAKREGVRLHPASHIPYPVSRIPKKVSISECYKPDFVHRPEGRLGIHLSIPPERDLRRSEVRHTRNH